jgi:chemotaxis protein CheC
MMGVEITLSELERDALTELVNIGVSRAAASLRKMIGRQVLLSVPSIEVIQQSTAAALIGERESDELVAVRQAFTGAFCGRALLIFPQRISLEIVRAVVGETLSADEIGAMEDEALAETGNVILNGCLATMANMLQQTLEMSLPEVVHGDGRLLFQDAGQTEDGLALFLYINFLVQERDIRGYIAMLMDLPSMKSLKVLINDFIARVMSDEDDGRASDRGSAVRSAS